MAISDFVLLYNKAAEALAKSESVGYDFYTGIADTKEQWMKYCKPYEKRLMVLTLRVVPAGSGEDPRTVSESVAGFLVDASPSPLRDSWLMQKQKAKRHSPL
jgi:hypothetical protein